MRYIVKFSRMKGNEIFTSGEHGLYYDKLVPFQRIYSTLINSLLTMECYHVIIDSIEVKELGKTFTEQEYKELMGE